jgi:hypothetical protein
MIEAGQATIPHRHSMCRMPSPLKKTTRITERVNLELRLDTRNMLLGAGANF